MFPSLRSLLSASTAAAGARASSWSQTTRAAAAVGAARAAVYQPRTYAQRSSISNGNAISFSFRSFHSTVTLNGSTEQSTTTAKRSSKKADPAAAAQTRQRKAAATQKKKETLAVRKAKAAARLASQRQKQREAKQRKQQRELARKQKLQLQREKQRQRASQRLAKERATKAAKKALALENKKPKAGVNAYSVYMKETFATTPGNTQKEKFTSIAQKWKTLTAEQKQPYVELARKVNEERRVEIDEFRARTKSVQPGTVFSLFVSAQKSRRPSTTSAPEWIKQLAVEYKQLSPEQLAAYKQQLEQKKQQIKQEKEAAIAKYKQSHPQQ